MRRQSGFTLIELMIVLAIIAIIAAIAIPNLLRARLNANEAAATSTLRNLASAQSQFQAMSKADRDFDGTGEFGGFMELSAAWDVRGDPSIGRIHPAVLSGAFRQPHPASQGAVSRSGYFFMILLPRDDGTGVCVDGDASAFGDVDPDLAETTWCCYAWPNNYRNSGVRTFVVNQTGDILSTDDERYSGPDSTGWDQAAAFRTTVSDSITGLLAVGTTGFDGNVWAQVN